MPSPKPEPSGESESTPYLLDDQIGFLLRKANQRHRSIFNAEVDNSIAPSQFSALAKLYELGPVSQNQLGRLIALDSATIKGVVNRLIDAGHVISERSDDDARLRMISLTDQGRHRIGGLLPVASRITELTVEPLSEREAATLHRLLSKIAQSPE